MYNEILENALNLAARLNPRTLVINVKEGDNSLVNARLPFALTRTLLRFAPNLNTLLSQHAPSMTESDVRALLNAINLDAILAELASGNAKLPFTLVDATDAFGRHAYIILE